jgi:hypothetical protein
MNSRTRCAVLDTVGRTGPLNNTAIFTLRGSMFFSDY